MGEQNIFGDEECTYQMCMNKKRNGLGDFRRPKRGLTRCAIAAASQMRAVWGFRSRARTLRLRSGQALGRGRCSTGAEALFFGARDAALKGRSSTVVRTALSKLPLPQTTKTGIVWAPGKLGLERSLAHFIRRYFCRIARVLRYGEYWTRASRVWRTLPVGTGRCLPSIRAA